MAILVVGGAGYIGSHAVRELQAKGRDVVVFDNLEQGNSQAIGDTTFFKGDMRKKADVQKVFQNHAIDAVMHCASLSLIEESMQMPERYYETNVSGTLNLLTAMNGAGVKNLVFCSSGAIYGEPERIPIDEEHPQSPISVYGHTKQCVEKILEWFDTIYGLKSVVLRCFNAAGADPSGQIGELHARETHLIPLAIDVAMGRRDYLPLFGTDYSTRDGSCVRDYVHVCDIADAHMRALDWLSEGKPSAVFNLGRGSGVSVREIVEAVGKVSGKKIPLQAEPGRPGDPGILIARSQEAKQKLGWQPKFTDITAIIETAFKWQTGAATTWSK
jgi:UDP-glucose 4-epimerase